LQENKFGLGVELEGKELSEFFKGANNALLEDTVPFSPSANKSFESRDYSNGKRVGHISAAIAGLVEIAGGLIGDGAAAIGTVLTGGAGAVVAVPAAAGATALIGHGVNTIDNAVKNLNSEGGTRFSPKEKSKVIDSNKAKNNGKTVCENCGTETVKAKKSEKGVTPPKSETQVDHITPKAKGGKGKAENGQVLCRDCNRKKSDKQ
jgi:HNH endonuclease